MPRLFLVHWNKKEALERARGLRASGWTVTMETGDGGVALKTLREKPPDVVVISMSRLPSHGREVGEALRWTKATREIPIVVVDTKPEDLEKTRKKVSGAIETTSAKLPEVLRKLSRGGRASG
jgi:CheY-like chemotaxis protein